MPRTKEQNAKMRQATRDKIQAAAAELFAYKGLAGTNVQEIADKAGISIGLLYRHYKTKEDLYSEIVEFALEGLKAITALFQTDGSPKELIAQIVSEVHADLAVSGEFVHILIFLTQGLLSNPETGGVTQLAAQDAKMLEATAALIQRGQSLGEFRDGDPLEMATLLFSSIQGLGVLRGVLKESVSIPPPEMIMSYLLKERAD